MFIQNVKKERFPAGPEDCQLRLLSAQRATHSDLFIGVSLFKFLVLLTVTILGNQTKMHLLQHLNVLQYHVM